MLFDWFIAILGLLSDENIIFDFCPIFQEHCQGMKQDLGVFLKLYCGWVQNSRLQPGK